MIFWNEIKNWNEKVNCYLRYVKQDHYDIFLKIWNFLIFFRTWCSKVFALPLLPADRIEVGWEGIKNAAIDDLNTSEKRALRQFRAYVTNQWLVRVGTEVLSVFGSERRTNNDLESFNSWFGRLVKVHKPGLPVWLEHVNVVLEDTTSEMDRLDQGLAIRRPKRKKNLANTKALRKLESRLVAGELTEVPFLGNFIFFI